MLNLRQILFPVDFSERSMDAAPFVVSIAKRFDADVMLLHAIERMEFRSVGMMDGGYFVDSATLVEQAEADLRRLIEGGFNGVRAEGKVVMGDPATLIVDSARTHATGLIAMPSHGYGPFRSLL